MNDTFPPFDESKLSAEDRDVLQAFLAREHWDDAPVPDTALSYPDDTATAQNNEDNDLLLLFHNELEDDIAQLRVCLQQIGKTEAPELARLSALLRPAHKIRGTSGAMGYDQISELAHSIEVIVQQAQQQLIPPYLALTFLMRAVDSLSALSNDLLGTDQERADPLQTFMEEATRAGINLTQQTPQTPSTHSTSSLLSPLQYSDESTESTPVLHVEGQRVERLAQHVEELANQAVPIENAEQQVEQALQELQRAQRRVQYLEEMLMALSLRPYPLYENHRYQPSSSLIARILSEASQQQNTVRHLRTRSRLVKAAGATPWEELEREHAQESESLLRALHEAVADVALASAHLRSAFLALQTQISRYQTQTMAVREDIRILRAMPFRSLVSLLRREIESSDLAQAQPVAFTVTGEMTEIDQHILAALKEPLVQLVRTCLTDTLQMQGQSTAEPHTIWLHVQGIGSEVIIEIGFSMRVQGGAIDAVHTAIRQLNGVISSRRNTNGRGISFVLRLPRSRGAVRCLQVRAGMQHFLVPFVQIRRISEAAVKDWDILYTLHDLLQISPTSSSTITRIMPVLLLAQPASNLIIGVAVDEIVQELELLVRPLAPYLRRPGISEAAIDGAGRVLLMVDLLKLLHNRLPGRPTPIREGLPFPAQEPGRSQPLVLIADDSPSMHQTLQTILEQENYIIVDALDGITALDHMLVQPPDIFILDMDMPNLNGFDLLSIMHLYPEWSNVKIIMLTSHNDTMHRTRAWELGAHAYLTKPADPTELLQTVRQLLTGA
jgi:chemosensory pili system protein ChpA (sensor histidine kinase/response regulator)